LRPANGRRFHASLAQLLAILGVIWLFAFAVGYAETGPGARLSVWGLSVEAARSYFWIASIAVIVVLDRRTADFVLLGTAAACAALPIWLVWLVTNQIWYTVSADSFDQYADIVWWTVFGWQVIVFWRILRVPYRAPCGRAVMLGLVYGVMLYGNIFVLPERPLFYSRSHHAERRSLNVEATYYRQAELADAMLEVVRPGRPGLVDLYFLGFAGYAPQAVFMREARQVRDIFDRHLGTEGRSAMLINNLDTVTEIPLANRHNLERMISGTAQIMDLEEDVLFVFITSHGAEDASVLVDFSPLGLNDLTASDLRSMLDASGIRWRVIVVSACFAGSFIDHLASPGTLLITAAAADRTSFGCGHERDWTYFGEAFFNQGIPESDSFVEAFNRAKAVIEQREKDEDISPSLPQISIGSKIGSRLEQWREDLDGTRKTQDSPVM
jgi:hypothetical protein